MLILHGMTVAVAVVWLASVADAVTLRNAKDTDGGLDGAF
jgi:hypothetical protein